MGDPVDRPYIKRLLDGELAALWKELPALMITGARATGKTTTAEHHVRTVVHLDRPEEALPFEADADFGLSLQPLPVLLDEWQAVPAVLGAIKRAVDRDPTPNRFLLTGSVRAALLSPTWPGTGRVVGLKMFGLTVREMQGNIDGPGFLTRLSQGTVTAFGRHEDPLNLGDYLDLALRGGYPQPALNLSSMAGRRWLESYLEQLFGRDVEGMVGPRDPARLRRYFQALAVSTAGVVDQRTLYQAADIDHRTATSYDRLLTNLFVIDNLPAWHSNRIMRLMKRPKRYVADPALAAAAMSVDRRAILEAPDLLGRFLDTFVLSQIRPETELSASRATLHHLRLQNGDREVDIVAELGANRIIGIEVKATATPTLADARHLIWLRDLLAGDFVAGAVLHTGPMPFQLSDRIFALPISSLWDADDRHGDGTHLLRSPANAARLLNALRRAESGEGIPRSLGELRSDFERAEEV